MIKRSFGDLESSILSVLAAGERVTVKHVQEALGNTDKYTTLMTVMSRLVDKKILGRERIGLRYEYWKFNDPTKSQSILKRIRSKLFGMKTAEVVSYLINEADDLSQTDLEEVEKIISAAKKKKEQGAL